MGRRQELVLLEDRSWGWIAEIWKRSRSNWHWPQLPSPVLGESKSNGEFPFENYHIILNQNILRQGSLYIENLFDHLIVHYIFCPRSLEMAGFLALAAIKGLKEPSHARRMVNIFSEIVVDSFRLERSDEDEKKVLLGWRRLAQEDLSPLDKIILGFLGEYWGVSLPRCEMPEVDLMMQIYSPGVRDRSLWSRQCQQTARILEPLAPGILGHGQVRSLEILNGNADVPLMALASELEPSQYEKALAVLGLKGDLVKWYRDQSYAIEIRKNRRSCQSWYPSGLVKWRHTDPLSELDIAYSRSTSPRLIPGVTTYKREKDCCQMSEGREEVPDLLVVLDSSRSMEGHSLNTKTHQATLAAFKACQFAHQQGAEVAAINFSNKYLLQSWTRDLRAVENVLVEYICARTYIPGEAILKVAEERPSCLILCITDTHIQNLYTEWQYLKKASEIGSLVLFCIDQAGRDKHVEESLKSLGKVYYINRLEDLLALVVETSERIYLDGESFISSQ